MYIINTDQGYIRGTIHNGLQFVFEKEDAQVYKEVPYQWVKDLHICYCCEIVDLELIN